MKRNDNKGPVAFIAAILVAIIGFIGAASCDPPTCPAGQVAEYDDDGYECEPDSDGNGVDDEDDSDD